MPVQVKPVEYKESHRAELEKQRYTVEEIDAIALFHGMTDAKYATEAGQVICNYVAEKLGLALTFGQWHDGNVYCKNHKGVPHVIIGSWWDHRYVLRGLVRPARRGARFRWFLNGQASTGALQVAHFAEEDEVRFPEFQKIADDQHAAVNAAAGRRRADTERKNP